MENNQPLKVLLIDDDSFLLNMYSLKFSKNNVQVATAQNATDALQKLKSDFNPDIVLLDIIMPGMSGLELLAEIRKQNLVPNATIVMLTNQSEPGDIERAKSLGVNGYIVKATTIPSELVQSVLEIHNQHVKK